MINISEVDSISEPLDCLEKHELVVDSLRQSRAVLQDGDKRKRCARPFRELLINSGEADATATYWLYFGFFDLLIIFRLKLIGLRFFRKCLTAFLKL